MVFDKKKVAASLEQDASLVDINVGDYVAVRVVSANQTSSMVEPIARTTLCEFERHKSRLIAAHPHEHAAINCSRV